MDFNNIKTLVENISSSVGSIISESYGIESYLKSTSGTSFAFQPIRNSLESLQQHLSDFLSKYLESDKIKITKDLYFKNFNNSTIVKLIVELDDYYGTIKKVKEVKIVYQSDSLESNYVNSIRNVFLFCNISNNNTSVNVTGGEWKQIESEELKLEWIYRS